MKKLFTLSLLLLPLTLLFGQEEGPDGLNLNKFSEVQPSPTPYAISKFGNVPVSYFSGQPNISIPLYTVEDKNISVPLNLSYHAGGIVVNEKAGWTGQNWSLMAGGVVTRTQRGLPDEKPRGYLQANEEYQIGGFNSTSPGSYLDEGTDADRRLLERIYTGDLDTEPDLFNFNFLGQSGSFTFNNQGEIITIPHSNLDVEVYKTDIEISGFRIIDANGFVYTFGGAEATERTSMFSDVDPKPDFNSSWYLTSVTTPAGGSIQFSYQPNEISYSTPGLETKFEAPSGSCSGSNIPTVLSFMVVQEMLLHKVTSRLAEVTFTTEEREDLEGGARLAKVEVKSRLDDELLYDYRLAYDYYNPNTDHKRLRLLSVSEVKDRQEICDDYVYYIEYNSNRIEEIGSFKQDHWGYQNSSGNRTLIPQFGADRNPDGVSLRGLISKIFYPTGGFSEFKFETHFARTRSRETVSKSTTANYDRFNESSNHKGALNLNCQSFNEVSIYYRIEFDDQDPPIARLMLKGGNKNVNKVFPSSEDVKTYNACKERGGCENFVPGQISGSFTLNDISSGAFTMEVEASNENVNVVYASLPYDFCSEDIEDVTLCGGARIKEIIDFAEESTLKRTFDYFAERSENMVLLNNITDGDYMLSAYNYFNEGGQACSINGYSSDNRKAGGQNVGYKQVEVRQEDEKGNRLGKTIYFYRHADIENRGGSVANPITPRIYKSYLQGLLEQVQVWDNSNRLLKVTEYEHELETKTYARGFKVGRRPTHRFEDEMIQVDFYDYYQIGYDLQGEWLKQTTERVVDKANGIELFNTVRYTYDPTYLVVREQSTTDSREGTMVNRYRYAFDIGSGVYAEMAEKNMLNTKVGVTTIRNGTVIKDVVAQYQKVDAWVEGHSLYVPLDLHVLETRAGEELRTFNVPEFTAGEGGFVFREHYSTAETYPVYDNYGNNLVRTDRTGKVLSALYAQTYPVATFINADNNQVGYTNFESTATGNWELLTEDGLFSGAGYKGGKAYKGRLQRTFSSRNATGYQRNATGYQVSFYGRASGGNTIQVNGQAVSMSSDWKYYTLTTFSTNNRVEINTNGAFIDNVSIHPVEAQLLGAYLYKPLVGLKEKMETNGLVEAYEYDHKNRLKAVKDNEGNTLQAYEYCYAEPRELAGDLNWTSPGLNTEVNFSLINDEENPDELLSYQWVIDEETFETAEASASFSRLGVFPVQLLVSHPAYRSLALSETVVVEGSLQGNITYSPSTIYEGEVVTFNVTNTGTNPVDAFYEWVINGVSYEGEGPIQHTFNMDGEYTATLRITHAAYEDIQRTENITIAGELAATLEVIEEDNSINGELGVTFQVSVNGNGMSYQLQTKETGESGFTNGSTYSNATIEKIFTNYSTTDDKQLIVRFKVTDGAGNTVYTNEVRIEVPKTSGDTGDGDSGGQY